MKQEQIDKHIRYLVYFAVPYFCVLLWFNLLQVWGFGFGLNDLGIFHQTIWNTAQGNFFETSIKFPYHENSNWLGFHFSILPIIATVPLYIIFPHIELLPVIHILLVTATALVLYKTALAMNASRATAFTWSIIYLINPITLYHAMFSYQDVSFSVLLISLGFLFMVKQRFRALYIILLLLILTKEHHGITVIGFGILWFLLNKNFKQTLIICLTGLAAFVIINFVVIPHFSPYGTHFMLAETSDKSNYARYQWLNNSPLEVLKLLPEKIFTDGNMRVIIGLLGPLLLLPLAGIIFIIPSLGDIALIILSEFNLQKSIIYYYWAPILPSLIIASIYGSLKLPHKLRYIAVSLVMLVNIYLAAGAISFAIGNIKLLKSEAMDWSFGKNFKKAESQLPIDAMVLSDESPGALLSARRKIAGYDTKALKDADYVFARVNPEHFHVVSGSYSHIEAETIHNLIQVPNWGLVYWEYPYAIFKKGAESKDKTELKEVLETTIKNHKVEMELNKRK